MTDSTLVSEGITMPCRLVLTRDGVSARAIFKDVDVERHYVTERTCGRGRFYLDWKDSHVYDNKAYVIDRLLDLIAERGEEVVIFAMMSVDPAGV